VGNPAGLDLAVYQEQRWKMFDPDIPDRRSTPPGHNRIAWLKPSAERLETKSH
jgi:hypothetical protein